MASSWENVVYNIFVLKKAIMRIPLGIISILIC
jgi:hypothetical protein